MFLGASCDKESAPPIGTEPECREKFIILRDFNKPQAYQIEEEHFLQKVENRDSVIRVSYYPSDTNVPSQISTYFRQNGEAYRLVDSIFFGANTDYRQEHQISFYQDSVVLSSSGRFFNDARIYDEGKIIYHLDSLGNPYLRVLKNGLIPPPTTRFEFGTDPYTGVLFSDWQFLGLPVSYYPYKETSYGDLPPPSGENYRTYSYQYDNQSRLQSFEKSWHEGSGEVWSRECFSLSYL